MIEYSMEQDNIYRLESYFEEKYKKEVLEKINKFEFPEEWTPKQVIDYITYKLDGK